MGGTGTKADKYRAQEKSCRVESGLGAERGLPIFAGERFRKEMTFGLSFEG